MSDFVAQSRFLAGIAAPDVHEIIAAATLRRIPANAIVTRQGATASELFLITKGRADVRTAQMVRRSMIRN